MESEILQQILAELKDLKSSQTNLEQGQLELKTTVTEMQSAVSQIRSEQSEMKSAISQIQEDVEIIRNATEHLIDWAERTEKTVSYTHLDVYKRQMIGTPICRCGTLMLFTFSAVL